MKIYVFGNPLVNKDSLPLKLLPELKKEFPKIEFIVADPNENFPPNGERDLIILDTVMGIKKPTILDLDDFQKNEKTPVSPHDYDLLFHLLLLKKTKKIREVKIIGLPEKTTLDTIDAKVIKIIASLL
jgi:Ni,Fe-hydrogenase maturation factor